MSRNATEPANPSRGNNAVPSSALPATSRPPARRGPSGAWSRLKPAVVDPLDVYGLPSKGETRLHEAKNQEAYYTKIVDRYMKFCATSGGREGLEGAFSALSFKDSTSFSSSSSAPNTITTTSTATLQQPGPSDARPSLPHRISSTDRPNDMPNILLAMRKLREGLLGSRRRDAFAQRAYIFIIHASILARNWEAYQPALLYLLDEIHPCTTLSIPELHEFVGYRVLDLACRQYELGDALTVRFNFRLRDRKVGAVLRALVQDDWVRFWRTRRAVDGYQRAIMEFAADRMRLHALKCLGRGYLSADRAFVERCTNESWEALVKQGVGWQLQPETGNVVIRKPKAK